jgi:hypothetical protein
VDPEALEGGVAEAVRAGPPFVPATDPDGAPPRAGTGAAGALSGCGDADGVEAGGVETGGVETRGVETGGVETGGVETRGVETGGVETGGVETGPVETGGT